MCSGDSADEAGTRQQLVFWAMNQILGASEYHAVFLAAGQCSGGDGQNALREAELLSYALSHGFGGVVLCTQGGSSNREIVQKVCRNVPLVLIDREIPGVQADFVGFQNRQSVFDATRYLISKGHRRIALVSCGQFTNVGQERIDGYRTALRCAFREDPYELILTPPLVQASSWPMLDAIIRLPVEERPTAVICENNDKAARLAGYFAANNINVPEDISLIAFDFAEGSLPNGVILSTVAQPFEDVGRAAARLILRRIQNSAAGLDHIELPTDFIENNSVLPAAARAWHSSVSLQELEWLNEERPATRRNGPQLSRFGGASSDNIA